MASSQGLLLGFLGLAVSCGFVAAAGASGSAAFMWKWSDNMISTDLTQCRNYSISILSLSSNSSSFGTPPYYMMAWKAGGISTVSAIGSDRNNLQWTVNQASGSSLILTVADSQGMAGGEAPSLYTVSNGDSSCLPSAPSTNVTLAANRSTSDPLETCDPLGLRVYGGQKPYTISLAAVGSPVITNITLGGDEDVLTWPNLADPNGQLMASVSDANGVWGTSTGIFKTSGPAVTNDTRCSTVTSSGNSSEVDQHPPQPSKSNTTTIAVAVIVPVIVCLLGGVAFFLWRRRQKQAARAPEPAFLPDAWVGPSIMDPGLGADSTFSPYDPPPSSKLARYRDETGTPSSRGSFNFAGAGPGYLSPGMPLTPRQPGAAFEGNSARASILTGSHSHSNGGSFTGGKGDPRIPPGMSSEWTIEPDIIIQHRDGGAVQEIPPPYPIQNGEMGAGAAASRYPPTLNSASEGVRLSVPDSSAVTSTSRPSSSGDPSPNSFTALHPTTTLNKGKAKATDLLT